MTEKYFIQKGEEAPVKEITKKEWIQEERNSGFWPKGLSYSDDPECTIPATAGFTGENGIRGSITYIEQE